MDTAQIQKDPQQPILPHIHKKSLSQNVREWIVIIIVAFAVAIPFRYFIAEPFIVSGASMDPTFASGQFLIVDRLSYRFEEPKRGDVIVFEYPNDPSIYYIKRIIGIPGDEVSISDGQVTITNTADPKGHKVTEPYVDATHSTHDSFEIGLGMSDYFVMGDNRAQSSDSRAWGPLDKQFIIGRPILRIIPFAEAAVWPGQHQTK